VVLVQGRGVLVLPQAQVLVGLVLTEKAEKAQSAGDAKKQR